MESMPSTTEDGITWLVGRSIHPVSPGTAGRVVQNLLAKMHSLFSIVPFLGVALTAPTASNGTPTAAVQNGTISGMHSNTYNQDMFLGIPYAQSPVGDLRFRNPQSLNTTLNGTYEATSYSPSCVGYGV